MADSAITADVPDRLFDDESAESRWRSRFTAARMSLPDPARDDPQHAVYISNETGTFELVCWEVDSGTSFQATSRTDGTTSGILSADGKSLWWFDDADGSEFGSWRHQPFGSGPESETADALPGVPPGYAAGVEVGRTLAIAGFSDDDGTRIHLAKDGEIRTVYAHQQDASLGALSRDETIWVLAHSEHGDARYPALRALDVESGSVMAELDDTPGRGLSPLEFSPVPGDNRLLVGHERRGRDELGIWDITSGEFTELTIDLSGDIDATFYHDAAALLLIQTYRGRSALYRYDLVDRRLHRLPAERGVITAALARPDGSIWYRHSSAVHGPRTLTLPRGVGAGGAQILLTPRGITPAASEPITDVWVDGPGGKIHAWFSEPAAVRGDETGHARLVYPAVFLVHGGPASADDDSFDAVRATYLDAGMAVVQVNYRGSTGYGSEWRDALTARVGHTELADIAAVQDDLVIRGLIDPDRCAIAGHSWGGFLTLLALGTQQSRWRCGVAGVPVADYLAAYEDEMEPMRAYDRALFGGSPAERKSAFEDSSPLTWVEYVQAPVLIFAGENDPRCPIRQINNYIDALDRRDKLHQVYRFNAGHGSMVVGERMRQVATEVNFVRQFLRG